MTPFTRLAFVLTLALPGIGAAASVQASEGARAEAPIVVELFTSQGCASCPPADALMRELAQRDDILPLALHVDYWDYIGWKDLFALPGHAERQKAYAMAADRRMIYTPQMIVMGQQDIEGASAMRLADTVAEYRQRAPLASVNATSSESGVQVSLDSLSADLASQGPFDVLLVRYQPLRSVSISRGELAGNTMDYANVVEDWTLAGQWDGQSAHEVTAPLPGELSAAVLVQQSGSGAIIAAARVD